ncbi:unnamed protein product [Didymodactylos carnosus]|uniref:DUF4371 domain-containing protein n=1 Tax=Didymodactylos carnosus TaxID=1234261 RepID=A0A814Z6V3_9BILA|nr:unnamed protein product [Didymodactylos carnosus]CAF4002009.1 unnamed protein product [Didymodactylos carnosus]
MLLTQISSIICLLRQGLPLRGHDEQESNLIQLMKLRSQDINSLKDWLNDKKYLLHDIVNELAKEISLKIIQDIIQQILERQWFALICDKTADEANKEQLCITIRSVDTQYVIYEDVIGLYQIDRQNFNRITEAIVDALTRCGLNIKQCRGQGYDNRTANMGGIHEGVAAKILQREKSILYPL